MQTASEMSTEQGSSPAGPPDARIDGIGGIGLEFASNTQPNGISPKKVRELAMRKVDPLPLRHDELGVYLLRGEPLRGGSGRSARTWKRGSWASSPG